MNIFITFNVGDLTPWIDNEDESHEDLRKNPLRRGGEVDAEQVAQDNLLNHIKAQCEFGLWSNQHKSFKGLVSLSL